MYIALAMKCAGIYNNMMPGNIEAEALSVTHACIYSSPHACNHERSIRKVCGK